MLLDLGRNDVGRISEIGSVVVTDEYIVERYSHVMHIVSNVTGKLKKNYNFIDAFFSALPAGTVSGAPKIRAMEIINELESEKRSFYAGGIGYFSSNGNGDFSIMLRTALLKDNMIYFQAGAGIVADSDPQSEYMETITKATAIIKATEMVSVP
jgi:anthranilate synthase component 1